MAKRISQLNALSSASLNTTLVGIDNGVTYKITLDVLEDAVINMLSASTDARLDFLETFSSSFNTFSASLDSRLDNVTIDTSSLATKTLLNTFTQSYYSDSASFDNRITSHISGTSYISESYNEFVTSYHAESSSFSNRIEAATNEQFIAGLLLTSSYQIDSSSFIERINQHISGTNYISESLTEFITSYHSESSSFSNRIEAATNEQFIAGLLLTSSYSIDSASFNSRIISGSAVAGTISSSAQITALGYITSSQNVNTSSFVTTSSFNAFTASAQMVTTGSNSFNGTQIITGSLIITTGSFIGTQIVANTASLYLTSGSNMYVQNNGVVEITGSLKVNGTTTFASVGGDEGGEIQFGIPTTNTTLQNRVTIDVWQNRLRIFEGSANANGVYIDLSKPTTGNNNEITYKASGLVNAGDFVTLDNIKATITTSGLRGLSLATISGTFVCNIAGNYAGAVVGASGTSGTATITTSASTSIFGWGFTTQGDIANYIITDTTNSRAYRITIQIGGSYLNNLVSIERLH